jgi:hypothetical protein
MVKARNIIWEELLRLKKSEPETFLCLRLEPVCHRVMALREQAARYTPYSARHVMARKEKESARIRRSLVDEEH